MTKLLDWIERNAVWIFLAMIVVELGIIAVAWVYAGVVWAAMVGAAFILFFLAARTGR